MNLTTMFRRCVPIAAAVALLLGAQTASAVSLASKGVIAGLNMATLDGLDEDPDSRFGMVVGAFADIALTDAIGVHPELLFSMKGATDETPAGDMTIKLDYIEVPVLVTYTMPVGKMKASLLVGPSFAYNVNAKFKLGSDEEDAENVEDIDYSLIGGAQVTLPMGLGIGVRYTYGLADIDDGGDTVTNQTISIVLSYGF
jgi:outer membrane protein with beta-barrel domain